MENKFYKQCWFWLMIISGFVLLNTVSCICYMPIPIQRVLYSGAFWTALGSVGTLISVIVAVVSIANNNKRTKKQSTLEAFTQFKENAEPYENTIHGYSSDDINKIIQQHEQGSEPEKWDEIKKYLATVERFATGVNTGIYDVEVVNKMAGYFLCEQYKTLYPIIEYKRQKDQNEYIYAEFRDMVNAIIRVRKRNHQLHIETVK